MLRTGIDLIEIDRVRDLLERYGPRFLERVFTQQEIAEMRDNVASLAGRFAVKEAVSKALGTGIGLVTWREIEVLRGPSREPVLHLHGTAARLAEQLGLGEWSVSISHTQIHAVGLAVAQSLSSPSTLRGKGLGDGDVRP
jgi:holo-[acyl-carrier protein] synthase